MRDELFPEFVKFLVRLPLFSNEVRRYSYGRVDDRLRLYWSEFRNLRIPVPPFVDQQQIVVKIEGELREISALEPALQTAIDLLKERRAALITAAVTGQIDLEEEIAA